MPRFAQRFVVVSGVACALVIAVGLAAWALATGPSEAQSGSMHNCPQTGKWSIAVWDGASGTAGGDALATCGPGPVDAAYSLDPETQEWWRWFAGKQEVSNMPPLSGPQGVLALGSATGPLVTPTLTATATPTMTSTATPTPIPGPELGTWTGDTSQGRSIEFDVVEGSLSIGRIEFGYKGTCGPGCTCSGRMETTSSLFPIINNVFSRSTGAYDISATFDSATSATGDLDVQIPDPDGCKSGPVTWTASAP